ncbi:MAG: putative hydro-lyase [Lachnoclostridium sp.]|nr:putative hydro-lyase [Lachnoclostridium sp.]
MADYRNWKPEDIWLKIRSGEIDYPTAGMCGGYAQANLVILPKEYAVDFKEFAEKNPQPCPVLEIIEGTPTIHDMGEGANVVTDIPKYFVYKDGVKVDEVTDASPYWKEDSVAFLIGCSFSFEEALLQVGIDVRHISMGCNVPMYKTNIECEKAGVFQGPMVCSMRPMTPEDAKVAAEITGRYPNVHGAPIHMGDPSVIGIADVNNPDYGDAVEIREGEIPVFWACGVTPQAAVERVKPPLVITHAPGHMFITNVKNTELNDYLEAKKQK